MVRGADLPDLAGAGRRSPSAGSCVGRGHRGLPDDAALDRGAQCPTVEAWLERHFPERKAKVMNRVRAMRGGKLNDPRFHFGASTRNYIIRERPQAPGGGVMSRPVMDELERQRGGAGGGGGGGYDGGGDSGAALLGLPQSETELDNLTEFNTAHNRRITMLGKT